MGSFLDDLFNTKRQRDRDSARRQILDLSRTDGIVTALTPSSIQVATPDNRANSVAARSVFKDLFGTVPTSMKYRAQAPIQFGEQGKDAFQTLTDLGIHRGSTLDDIRRALASPRDTGRKTSDGTRPSRTLDNTDSSSVNTRRRPGARDRRQGFLPDRMFDSNTGNSASVFNENQVSLTSANNSLDNSNTDFANLQFTVDKQFEQFRNLMLANLIG